MRALSHSLQTLRFFNVAGMDYSQPVARRTRSKREAYLIQEYNEKFRNKEVKIGESESVSESEWFFKVDKSVKDCVDSVVRDVSEKLGANDRGKDKGKSVVSEEMDNPMPIILEGSDDDDDDVVHRGEKIHMGAECVDRICLDDDDVLCETSNRVTNNVDENVGVAVHEGSSDDDDDDDDGDLEEYSDELEVISSDEDSDDPDDEDYSSGDEEEEGKDMDKRTRSHISSESRKNKRELGTENNPFLIDLEDMDPSSRLEAEDNDDDNGCDDETDHGVSKMGFGRKKYGKNLKTVSKIDRVKAKKKKSSMMKDRDVEEILLNSILDVEEIPLEDSLFSKSEVHIKETSESDDRTFYPVKFNFGNEEPTPPEKPEFEKEMDSLWTEMDFAIAASAIGSTEPSMDEKEVEPASEIEHDQATCCAQGKHKLILDEEIGIICKFCSFVQLEIRYIVPSFVQNPWERYRRGSNFEDDSGCCDLHFEDSGLGSQSGLKSCSRAEGTVWDLVPGIKNSMYPHQREGFEFIWRNIAGGIDLAKLKEQTLCDSGNGCVISHAPGTGKTRLAIVFLQAYMKMYPTCRPVIVAPCNMLLTWEEEFKKWKTGISFHNFNNSVLTGKELLELNKASESLIRTVKLFSWKKGGSVLGISYTRFKLLVGNIKNGEKKKSRKMDEHIRKTLLELPSLFVFDEGHIPRNEQTDVFKALSEIRTEKRIILSGTPFQNNFEELFNTFYLVRPKFALAMQCKNKRDSVPKRGRKRKAEMGKWASLTSSIGKAEDRHADEKKLNELRTLIAPFVHVHKGTVLQDSLPGLRQSVVVLRPFDLQKQFLESFEGETDMVKKNHYVSLVSAHPSLLLNLSDKQENFKDKLVDHRAELERIRLNPGVGTKTKFFMELLRLSEALNEKVLVFSEYIKPLRLIADQLQESFNWIEGRQVLYMDGTQDVVQRQSSINVFNDPLSKAKVLLASKAACCEGINLVGASRLVLLDVSWNPSRDSQAISRAYRLGQKKFVHVYRLITSGTIEEKKCSRQAKKDWLSRSVFFSSDGQGNEQNMSLNAMEDKILEEMLQHNKLNYIEKIEEYDESKLIGTFGLGW